MDAARLLRRARSQAGISQAELARRMSTSQPTIARWEKGRRSPTVAALARALRACGMQLTASFEPRDEGEEALLAEWSRLTPKQRLDRNARMLATEAWARKARPVAGSRDA